MANVPTFGTYIPGTYINAVGNWTETGASDPYGNVYPTGISAGKVIELGDGLAASFGQPGLPTLYGGAYQWVQVDAGATAANVQAGLAAFIKFNPTGTAASVQPQSSYVNMVVTDQAHADSINFRAGVFVNAIPPGTCGWVFVGAGRVNVQYRAALTNGTPAFGDVVGVYAGGNGLFDDLSAGTTSAVTFGYAAAIPAANALTPIYIRDIIYRIPGV